MKEFLMIAFLGAALCGCGTARRGEPLGRPLPAGTDRLEQGKISFQRHCHQCHPHGEGGLGPTLNNKPAPAFLVKTQVRLGMGVMPSFNETQIPDDELSALADYVVALRKADGPEPGASQKDRAVR